MVSVAFHKYGGNCRGVAMRMTLRALYIVIVTGATLLVTAANAGGQGPSLAATYFTSTADDLFVLSGASAVLRPPTGGVALHFNWLEGSGDYRSCSFVGCRTDFVRFRRLAGGVGYVTSIHHAGSVKISARPGLSAVQLRRTLSSNERSWRAAASGDVEAAVPLFKRLSLLVSLGGGLEIPLLPEQERTDYVSPRYLGMYLSGGISLGLMYQADAGLEQR